jgi:sRNA-binding carbon storage regulator CsrA
MNKILLCRPGESILIDDRARLTVLWIRGYNVGFQVEEAGMVFQFVSEQMPEAISGDINIAAQNDS